jgi:hypothetical protein
MGAKMKKGDAKNRFVHSFALLLVLVVAVGIVFFYSNIKFTGFAVLSGFGNQTSCEAAGHTWTASVTQNCTAISGCVLCATGCVATHTQVLCAPGCLADCTNITNCTTCATGCVQAYTETLCASGCLASCQQCVNITTGGQCTGDVCDASHLSLCLTETTCTGVSGYWYNSACNAAAQCVPGTCSSLNYVCGSVDDGCGTTLTCGDCTNGTTCTAGACVTPTASNTTESDVQVPVTAKATQTPTCAPSWQCDATWGDCTVDGTQVRTCVDSNQCGTESGMPPTSQGCTYEIKANCSDGIKNQDETDIDCGGSICKQCSFFTIVGSAVSGAINASSDFVLKGMFGDYLVITISVLAFLIVGTAVFILFKKKIISMKFSFKKPEKLNLNFFKKD